MSGEESAGVAFPASADGRRSTSALGRAVVADALGRVDPAGALRGQPGSQLAGGLPDAFPQAHRGRADLEAGRGIGGP